MITGPVQLRVHYEDVERAREALEDLRAPSE
jgi:hypothetical protein